MEECERIGVYRTCPHNAQSCMIETRKRNGLMEQVNENFIDIMNLNRPLTYGP